MPEWSGAPKESKPHRLISRLITTSCAKVPPAPPYCSGIVAHSRPAAPALAHTSRSYMPCWFQRSRCGVNSPCMKRRACSSSSTTSSLIQAGRGRSRAVMARRNQSVVWVMVSLKVPPEIHALVQDTNHLDATRADAEKDHMRSSGISAVTMADVIAGPPLARVAGDGFDRTMELAHVAISLVDVPMIGRVAPNPFQIRTSAR